MAAALSVASAVLWLPVALQASSEAGPSAIPIETLLAIVYLVLGVRAAGGRQKARIGLSIVVGLLFFALAPFAWLGFTDPNAVYGPEYAVLDILALAGSGTAVVLFFLPASNAYFRRITARRRAPANADSDHRHGSDMH